MKFLLDTNVLSELRKGSRCKPRVAAWFQAAGNDLFVSVLVLGEIRNGIERIRGRDPAQAQALSLWLAEITRHYSARILPIDLAVADSWGQLRSGRGVPAIDGLMAATAIVHGLTIVTNNVKDFAPTGVAILNPFGP